MKIEEQLRVVVCVCVCEMQLRCFFIFIALNNLSLLYPSYAIPHLISTGTKPAHVKMALFIHSRDSPACATRRNFSFYGVATIFLAHAHIVLLYFITTNNLKKK